MGIVGDKDWVEQSVRTWGLHTSLWPVVSVAALLRRREDTEDDRAGLMMMMM